MRRFFVRRICTPLLLTAAVLSSAAALADANPLAGKRWFINRRFGLAQLQERYWRAHGHPQWAELIRKIADQPQTERYGPFTPDVGPRVRRYLFYEDATEPGTTPLFAAYRLLHTTCGGYADSPAEQVAYRSWITAFANAIGSHRAVVFLEPDALVTIGCLSPTGLKTRLAELAYGARLLGRLPHTVTYIDAGAADGDPSAARMAVLLRRAGISHIRGFFLNATHFDWTSRELRFGNLIARRLKRHFVVSTAANGRGPLIPRDPVAQGNEMLCNPTGRALGRRPTTHTGDRLADAFMWVGNPGRSGGSCHPGDPGTGQWFPRYALDLAANASY